MSTTEHTATALTREEAAYAHLASFVQDQRIVVTSPRHTLPGVIVKTQRGGSLGVRNSYIVAAVTEPGLPAPVSWTLTVDGMLRSHLSIAAEDDAAAGKWEYFDADAER